MSHTATVAAPGPLAREVVERCRRLEGGGLRTFAEDPPLTWDRASGSRIEDADGRRYLDLYAGYAVATVGYGHPRVVEAIQRQAEVMLHCPSAYPSRIRAEFLEAMGSIAPVGLDRVLPAITGSMANELALAVARTRRQGNIVTFTGSYFGRSVGVVGLAGRRRYREALSVSQAGVMVPYPYPLWMGDRAADASMEALAEAASSGPLSAVIVEPVQGNGGVVAPPEDFLPRLRSFCDEVEALLILDEIQSGCGRTGRMWAFEHTGIVPDLMTVGKGIGGGMPVAAVLGRADLLSWPADTFTSTFLTNAINLAAAAAAIGVLREEDLAGRAARLGPPMLARLRENLDVPGVAEVRGLGLWSGIELVDADGRPWPEAAGDTVRLARMDGVIVGRGGHHENVVKISPPLVISDEELETGLDVVVRSVGRAVGRE